MAWLASHQTLEKNGKLTMLAEMLGITKWQAMGHLHCLWWWALDAANAEGNISKYCVAALAEASGWAGYRSHPNALDENSRNLHVPTGRHFVVALINCGFIDHRGRLPRSDWAPLQGEARVHDWQEYSEPYYSWKLRREHAKTLSHSRVLKFREKSENETLVKRLGNAQETAVKRFETVITEPNLTESNLTKKKRRKNTLGVSASEDPLADQAAQWWNDLATKHGLRPVKSISDTRRSAIHARQNQDSFDPDALAAAIAESSFLRGESKDGWKISFDWLFCSRNNFLKVLEGTYKDPAPRKSLTLDDWKAPE